ncbi:MAG TPA: type VI secretion system membrane subunit TssM [Vicinamibacterales bacterium]|jgi:type VI secretion system protein ImpL
MFAFLKRTVVILIGLLLIVVFIWFAGPYFAFADWRPLDPPTNRLIAIGVVIGCWIAWRLLKRLRAMRAGDRLLAAVAAPRPQAQEEATPAEVVKLRERFEEAVGALKEQQRTSGTSLYDLPWYVIIGAPGSGKTTALLNSGLKFPLEQRVGKGALRGVGGTRNCDWWFADEAVFLDTAGRYTTQDSDAASDSVGWSEFLALLRKYRARRPVNGVILTINAQDLLVGGPSARGAHVDAARRRLEELSRELGIQLPVYVMVTKCDLVDGFAEYFDDLRTDGRAQVWGVTFPYGQSVANEGPGVFPAEFDSLMARLNERVVDRMQEARDTRRRTKIFGFPQQMSTMREPLSEWLTDVFASREFGGQILLRGVYFTSGTQEGTPIDRLLGSIGRRFGAGAAVMAPQGPGKAYFVETLLKTVMIGESGLAGVNRQLELRKASAQLGAYAATGILATAGVVALSVSYKSNHEYLTQAAADIDTFEHTAKVTPASPLELIVARLDAIRGVVDSANRYRDTTPLLLRWGLYQGGAIGNSARDAYMRELDSILLPRLASQIHARMRQYSTQPEKLYEYLKGYLMLGEPKHLDKDHLQMLADLEWHATDPAIAQAASQHFKSLLDNAGTLRPVALDGPLVTQARASIQQASMARILYNQIKSIYADPPGAQGLRLDQQAGIGADTVFRRRSGVPLSTPMPTLYTRDTFKQITTEGRAVLLKRMADDSWVWGDSATGALANAGSLVSTVTNLYEQDYIRAWNAVLEDLQFATFPTIPQLDAALQLLAGPTSPLRGLLRVVADNTTLVQASSASAPTGALGQATQSVKQKFEDLMKPVQGAVGMAAVNPGTVVTAQFQWARQLTAGEAGKTQLDGILKTLGEIQQQLDTLGPDVAGGSPVQILSNPAFRVLMQTLRQQTEVLPPGLRTLVAQIGEGSEGTVNQEATSELHNLYLQTVVPACQTLIAGKYPFANSNVDVQPADLGTVFGFDGAFDKFFSDRLAKQVDTTGPVWAWRPGSVMLSNTLLAQFQAAQAIRDMFFQPGSKTPSVRFFVTFSDLDSSATRFVLALDGQNFDDKHFRQPGVWPGPQAGSATTAWESRYYDPTKAYGGPWAWFRLIDEYREGVPDPQHVLLNVKNRYHRVHITVEPSSAAANPFTSATWRQFSCES